MTLKGLISDWSKVAYQMIDCFVLMFLRVRRTNSLALVRLDAIGDFILWLDSAKEYRRLYAGKHIVLIANDAWAEWAKDFPFWDEVWNINTRRFERNLVYRAQILFKMREAGFETVIQPTYSRSFHGDSLVRASAAVRRIASVGDESNISSSAKCVTNRWYTQLIYASEQRLMELERNAEFLRNLSESSFFASMPRLLHGAASERALPWPNDYVVLFPGASWSGRQWPLAHFAELASRLYGERGWPFVLCGGPSDLDLCRLLGAEMAVPFVNWAGKTNLPELAHIIAGARLLISNETSAIHIAAAFETHAVCILGGGHYGRFLPYPTYLPGIKPLIADYQMSCFNCNWVCSQIYAIGTSVPCINRVSVQRVLDLALIATKD